MSNFGDSPENDPQQPGSSRDGFPPPGAGGFGAPPPQPPPPGQAGPPPGYGAPPPGYGAFPYGYPYAPGKENDSSAVTVMVLGIVSLVLMMSCFLGFIPAIIALMMAPDATRKIEESGGRLGGEGMIKAGKICSFITLALTALGALAMVAWFALSFLSILAF